MATLREIRRRILSVKNTQKITRAMKMVAAAKLRRAQENILNARPYALKYSTMIKHLAQSEEVRQHPFIRPRQSNTTDPKKILLVVVSSDRSLCGAFNSNIFRKVRSLLENEFLASYQKKNLQLLTVGRKGYDYFHKRGFTIPQYFIDFFKHMNLENAREIVNAIVKEYNELRADEVHVVYNEFKSVLQQQIVCEQLLPVRPEIIESEDQPHRYEDYIYEPSMREITEMLIPRHLNVQMWRILLESFASEMGARMNAMETATENAGEMINSLTLFYNRNRQAAITKEILEVIAGAEVQQK